MQLGFVSAILPELSLEEVIVFAYATGYDCVEIMCWPKGKAKRRYAGVTHIDVDNLDKERIIDIKEMTSVYNVEISALGYYPNPLTPDRKSAEIYQQHIKSLIKAAADLEVWQVNTFVGRDQSKTIEENWPYFLKTWKELIKVAEDHSVKIGIENCPMKFSADEWPGGQNLAVSPSIWKRMFEDIDSDYFGLNYDPSHLVLQQMDYVAPTRNFSEKLFHIHAKDLRIEQHLLDEHGIFAHPKLWHSPKLPGLGNIDWGAFFSTLNGIYDGPVCVEVEDRAYEGSLELRKKALRQSFRYLRQFM